MLLPLRFGADVFSPVADVIATVCLISRLMLLPCC